MAFFGDPSGPGSYSIRIGHSKDDRATALNQMLEAAERHLRMAVAVGCASMNGEESRKPRKSSGQDEKSHRTWVRRLK
jgi:hypothetical protein